MDPKRQKAGKSKSNRALGEIGGGEIHSLRLLVAALGLLLAGLGMIVAATLVAEKEMQWVKSLFETVGSSVLTLGVISFIYEFYLRRSFLDTVKSVVRNELVRAEGEIDDLVKSSLEAVVDASLPRSFQNIKDSGIVDAYENLEPGSVKRKILSCHNTRIRFSKMWIPYMYSIDGPLLSAIATRGCTVQVLLYSPDAAEAIEKRAAALPSLTAEMIRRNIEETIAFFSTMRKQLTEEQRVKLEVKLHRQFIGASIFWYGDVIVFGGYLDGRPATEGYQIKIAGADHDFYRDLSRHFERQWSDPGNEEPDWSKYEERELP